MLKIKLADGGLLFGIDAENVKRLKEGKPIQIHKGTFGMPDDIFIVYGETLNDILDEFDLPRLLDGEPH